MCWLGWKLIREICRATSSSEILEELANGPEKINDDPYGDGWMVKVRLSDPSERDALLDTATYTAELG